MSSNPGLVTKEAEALCKITEGLEQRIETHEALLVHDSAKIKDSMHAAVVQGLHEVVSDPQFWSAAATAMKAQAQQQAGGVVMRLLSALLSRLVLVGVALWAIYSLGGWPALLAWVKSAGHS